MFQSLDNELLQTNPYMLVGIGEGERGEAHVQEKRLQGFQQLHVSKCTAATDCVVYSATVTGAVSGAVTATTNWVAISNIAAVAAASPAGAYTATASTAIAEYGTTVTVTVKCTTAPTSNTDTVKLTGVAGGTASTGVTFTTVGNKDITFAASAASYAPILSVTNAA